MPRPETLADLPPDEVPEYISFASIEIDKIADRGDLIKAYGAFMEACQKAGCDIEIGYRAADFRRPPKQSELDKVLRSAQCSWDTRQGYYEKWAAGEELTNEYHLSYAKEHAMAEKLPMFPWEQEGRFDAPVESTLSNIDRALGVTS